MLYLRLNINLLNDIIHNIPVHMYCRILRIKKNKFKLFLKKNNVVNSVVVVSFVVVAPAPNVISVNYDGNNNNNVSEARVGTTGTVYLASAKTSEECY